MPSLEGATAIAGQSNTGTASSEPEIVFPPITKDHILNCSYDSWFPKYRQHALKSRIIKLPPEFIDYLGEDGIILADDDQAQDERPEEEEWTASAATSQRRRLPESESDSDSEPESDSRPPNERFPELHQQIKDTIRELGGAVAPKLNWSSPKDAVWISPHQNTLKCTTPNDIYLLLKSSSFVSHDLEHVFDDTTDMGSSSAKSPSFQPVLVLRPFFCPHPALEFRCFVKHRSLIGLCSRDLNHYSFLEALRPAIVRKISDLFEHRLRFTFPDGSFVFDVYLPEDGNAVDGLGRVRLIDINPWAPRTDSLLFDWGELLKFKVPRPILGSVVNQEEFDEVSGTDEMTDDDEADYLVPELRLMERDNPASSNFSSSQYSAHKLPKEVVDASTAGEGGLREFMQRWREMTEAEGGRDVWETGQRQG
ncbi:cell division cycle protein [Sodiomyces alkalinus F11]|uniref:Cell division cycle protein n=1 Tax=Sodiomyces alkalinus (strain CBS 110278 / VKM F-3762 / F11) TaxID=1314773 RepID=A0A3N2Q7S6_SODAK|nr:cell division cycle protein [Sodiomyces alkalinus F11]ROT42831.1 cell division cycle protein [Sodiomyces alkalinus F11]